MELAGASAIAANELSGPYTQASTSGRIDVSLAAAALTGSSGIATSTSFFSYSLVEVINEPVCCGVNGDLAAIAQRAQASTRHFDGFTLRVDENE